MSVTPLRNVPDWPTNKVPPAAAGSQPGHNRPDMAEDALASFRDLLDQRPDFDQRVRDVLGSAERAQAVDDETLGRCGDLVKQIRACMTVIGDAHTETKKPFLEAGRALDAEKNRLIDPLERAKRIVEGKQSEFLRERERARAEEERQRREAEAAQRREEAVRAAAQQSQDLAGEATETTPDPFPLPLEPATPDIVRGDFGAAVSARGVWKAKIIDIDAAYLAVRDNAKVVEAIEKAVAGMVRSGARKIDGCHIYQDITASNR